MEDRFGWTVAIYSFAQSVITEYLLCLGDWAGYWGDQE